MLSQPERVIDVIRTAAKSVQGAGQRPKARQGYVLASGLSLATVLPRFRQVFSERVHSGQSAVLPG
jgi:hypothetical protein